MKAEHYSEELEPNCKEKGREESVTQIANIKNEANRPRNRATTPNMSPLSATPSSATKKSMQPEQIEKRNQKSLPLFVE